jgi:hypothetical protein
VKGTKWISQQWIKVIDTGKYNQDNNNNGAGSGCPVGSHASLFTFHFPW